MRPAEDRIKRLFEQLNDSTRPELDQRILDACTAELRRQEPAAGAEPYSRWRLIMNHSFTKFTAAAMVFLAVILGVTFFPNSKGPIALASVLDTLKNAACVSYDIQMGKDAVTIHDTVYGQRIRRESMEQTSIIDLEQMRILTLNDKEKQAFYINMDGLPELPKNYIEHLIHILETLQNAEKGQTEALGQRDMDDRVLDGYLFTYQTAEVEIWIDPDTLLPVIITERGPGMEMTCRNFDFSVEPDPTRFEMTPPEGYSVIDTQGMIDFKKDATEEAFIEGLRFLAHLRDGWFPREISIESFMRNAEEIGTLVEQKFEGPLAQAQAGMQLGKGLVFLRVYSGRGPWHYAGNGVKLGQAEKPVFWYPPKDSEAYRVIFGDLHVEQITPEDLDSVVSQSTANSGYSYQLWGKPELIWEQEDLWRVKAGGIVEVTSTLTLKQGPAFIHSIPMTLPIKDAEVLSATLNGIGLPYQQNSATEYVFFPDGEQLANGANTIELVWQFPLESLAPMGDEGYTVPLKTPVPVIRFRISAGIEPGSGYTWTKSGEELEKSIQFSKQMDLEYDSLAAKFTGEPPLVLFKTNGAAASDFGTCGLMIKP